MVRQTSALLSWAWQEGSGTETYCFALLESEAKLCRQQGEGKEGRKPGVVLEARVDLAGH